MNEDRISITEDLMVEALKSALPDTKVEPRTSPLTEEELKKILGAAPFVFLEYNGGNRMSSLENGSTSVRRNVFNLFVAAKSLRSKQEAQRGSYSLLSAIFETLDGATLKDDEYPDRFAGPFTWESEAIFFDSIGGTIYQAVYSVTETAQ